MSVEDKVTSVLAGKALRDPSSLRPTDRLADIGVDSVAMLEVLFILEDAYDIDIALPERSPTRSGFADVTVADLVAEVGRRVAERAA